MDRKHELHQPQRRRVVLPLVALPLAWGFLSELGPQIAAADVEVESKNPDEPVVVETVAGETQERLVGFEVSEAGIGAGLSILLRDRRIEARDLLRLGYFHGTEPPRDLTVVLADGSRLSGALGPGSDAAALDFNGPLLPAGVRIPLEWVRRLDYAPARDGNSSMPPDSAVNAAVDPKAPRAGNAAAAGSDVVVTQSGGVLAGVVELITGRGVTVKDQTLGVLEQPWEKIATVIIAPLDAPPRASADALRVVVTGRDGSTLAGELLALDRSTMRLRNGLVGDLDIATERIDGIEFLLGRVVPLSSREPLRFTEGNPYMSSELFARACHWRRDQCVTGGPLNIGGRVFRRGIGVHAETRLVFAIEPSDRLFQTWIGVDQSARPITDEREFGSVVFRVLVDGTERMNSGDVNWESPPRRHEVSLEGGKELELVVEMGQGFHILDRADWGDARILKE